MALAIDSLIVSSGFKPYSVSSSPRDKYDCLRHYYDAKDHFQPYRDDKFTNQHVFMLIDVDYYVDMPRLMGLGRPIILYTFAPMAVAGTALDARFYIHDNVVQYHINGGGLHKHEIWDYNTDCLTADTRDGSTWYYQVESMQCAADPHRRVVFLMPKCLLRAPESKRAAKKPLLRMKYTQHNTNVLHDISNNTYSVAQNGSMDAVTIDGSAMAALKVPWQSQRTSESQTLSAYCGRMTLNSIPPLPVRFSIRILKQQSLRKQQGRQRSRITNRAPFSRPGRSSLRMDANTDNASHRLWSLLPLSSPSTHTTMMWSA